MKEKNILNERTDIFIFAAFILTAIFLFYYQDPLTGFLFLALCLGICLLYFGKTQAKKNKNNNSRTLIFISAAFIALKFYKIFSFPPDFFGDEWTDIISARGILKGNYGFFGYTARNGAALPYISNWITALAMKLITYRLDLLRFIPVLVFTATAYGFWKLGKQINIREPAAYLFVYTLSEWAWKTSKLYLANVYVPFFIVFFLVVFLSAARSGSLAGLSAAVLLFACGFFTYSTWILMAPFAVYLGVEYRTELGGKKFSGFIFLVVSITIAAFMIYIHTPGLAGEMASRTVLSSNNGIMDILWTGIRNIYIFFLTNKNTDASFIIAPFFYAVEAMLIIFGLVNACLNIRERENRILLAGLILSLSSLVFTPEVAHPYRHVTAFTFAALLCGKGLTIASANRKFMLLLVPAYVFSALSFMMVYYFIWGSMMPQTMIDRRMADYINMNYGNSNVLFIHDSEPFGRNMDFLRTKAAYRDESNINFDHVIFTTPVSWHHAIKSFIPDIDVKYFFEQEQSAAVWVLNVENHRETLPYFMEISKNLSEIDDLMWKKNYDRALDLMKSKQTAQTDPFSVLQNTFLKAHESNTLYMTGKINERLNCLLNKDFPALELPDNYYAAGLILEENKQYGRAYDCYKKALYLAPEWILPAEKLYFMDRTAEK